MLHVERFLSEVPGMKVNSTFKKDNPAGRPDGRRFFCEGWHQLVPIISQENPSIANLDLPRICVVWTKQELKLNPTDGDKTIFVTLVAGDCLDKVTITEEVVGHRQSIIHGLWLNVFYTRKDETKIWEKIIYHRFDSWRVSATLH